VAADASLGQQFVDIGDQIFPDVQSNDPEGTAKTAHFLCSHFFLYAMCVALLWLLAAAHSAMNQYLVAISRTLLLLQQLNQERG